VRGGRHRLRAVDANQTVDLRIISGIYRHPETR
jgi:hypothetical protein